MKTLYYFLFVLPLFLVSCNDDDNLPNVDFEVSISNGLNIEGILYVLKGDTLSVDSIEIVSLDNKGAVIGSVTYYWDYYMLISNPFPPYNVNILTDRLNLGNHLLQFECPVYVVDYPLFTAYFSYPIKLVESIDDIPNLPSMPLELIPKIKIKQ